MSRRTVSTTPSQVQDCSTEVMEKEVSSHPEVKAPVQSRRASPPIIEDVKEEGGDEEVLAAVMQKSLEDLTGKDMQSIKDALGRLQHDEKKMEEIRDIVRETGMEEEVLKKVTRGINHHGETVPKRKMVLRAKKEAKKAMNAVPTEEFAAEYKGLYINASRKTKTITYTYSNLSTVAGKLICTSTPMFTEWGNVVVVHAPEKGHLRNKLVERLFSRDASFGLEVFVFQYEEDIENEASLRHLLTSQGTVTPRVWELPSSE